MEAGSRHHVRARCTILVAEDDSDLRELLWLNLRLAGHHVLTACDGEEALRAIAGACPDLIVLDVMMPGHDGISVLRSVRADPATAQVPVIVLSAKAAQDEIWHGWAAGADHYLTKPARISAVVELVGEVLGRGRARSVN